MEAAHHSGYALPHLVVALSLVFFGIRVVPWAYQSLGMAVFALVVIYVPLALASLRASMLQVPPTVEEAARGLGRGPVGVTLSITAPLVRPGILAGATLVYIAAIKELPSMLLLAPTGFRTMATEIWALTNLSAFEAAAVPSLVLLAVSAPVLALFGFEYYATTGGLALGLVFGLVAAGVIISAVRSFRTRMAKLEEGSEAYKKYASKKWVKVLTFVLIGGNKGKRTYAELNAKRYGLPIRPLGVVFALLLVGLGFLINALARDEIVTAMLKRGMESANGATVDIENAELNFGSGRLLITGFAMADPERLDTDLLRAKTIEADVSSRDLLRKRIALDGVVARDAYTGEKRLIPGHRTRPATTPASISVQGA